MIEPQPSSTPPPPSAPPSRPAAPSAPSAPRSPYIVGRAYDWAFFLLPPVVSLAIGVAVAHTPFSEREVTTVAGQSFTWEALVIGALIHAHLVAVVFRSHANPAIFRRHPVRFVLVPIALFFALRTSLWAVVIAMVLATFWDVWHSGAQTFGLARIYERNAGNPPTAGRALDFWLNQLLYAGPIVAGASMLEHFKSFEHFEQVGAIGLSNVPAYMFTTQRQWARGVLAVGVVFVAVYLVAHVRMWRRGHRVSWLKLWLVASTGLCSVYTWGFDSWGEAFFIMNLFHAVQYLALVWATEGRRLAARIGGPRRRALGVAVVAAVFFGFVLAYGAAAALVDTARRDLWAVTMVVSLMHFWYDGFIWSVARREI